MGRNITCISADKTASDFQVPPSDAQHHCNIAEPKFIRRKQFKEQPYCKICSEISDAFGVSFHFH